ncbi:transporter substrate-binding domain-containing protein [Endozoicomonas sp. SM1973]|uniref:Transporter substrate-binding domain-containing protein n=1 Tax=Spartinivicinus marinus TaxID=2994442 RepID=A0A853I2D8_9GAMM|nr:transporter substrate-binding domain-containing protein [Spartinivicinus marinus]MCX4026886.1 transporter substrate-binding domain-containing protein [Spartinivicinus marinus]NYZ66769.1 transporter substrate-binding domain-containing protein [Spartinivicinus marinus]
MMIKALVLALLGMTSVFHVQSGVPVIVLADNSYPPYSYEVNGEAAGIYTDILLHAFRQMTEYNIEIHPVPWKRGLKQLELGESFALYPPYLRKETRPYIDPYSTPILAEKIVLVCREEIFVENKRVNWPEDFSGLTIGRNSGFEMFSDYFWKFAEKNRIKVEEARGNHLNILKLLKKRIPCYVNDKISILWGLEKLKQSGEYKPAIHGNIKQGPVLSSEWGYLGYTNRGLEHYPFKKDFIKKLDSILTQMRKNGLIDKIVNNYIK